MASQNLPSTMKAVQIQKTGGVDVLEYVDVPVPEPKDDEVLVKNKFIGVNYIDTYFRTGLYPAPSFPYILGREASGTIATPNKSGSPNFEPGARVVFFNTAGYAEYTAVPARNVLPIPASIDDKTACAVILQGLTALTLIEEAHKVNAGDWVLVHAAAGGVGGLLVQMLKLRGAHTVASASTEEKRNLALEYGADVAVPYDQVKATVEEKTGGKGVVAVFDGVGKVTFDEDLEVVARKGTVVSFGNASGAVEPLAISRLSAKNAKVCRPTLFNYIGERDEMEKYTEELWGLVEKGVKVPVHEVYKLSDSKRAHTDIEGRKTAGKLLITP